MKRKTNTAYNIIKRHAKIVKTAASVGSYVLANKIRAGTKQEIAEHLRFAFGGLKGPLMKISQFLAAVPGIIPPEYERELSKVQANAPPMGAAFVMRRMASELGENWRTKFKEFELKAANAASLGQVHKAISRNNKLLACKLQYPNMDSIVRADLAQIKLALMLFEKTSGAILTEQIFSEIRDRLNEELDYLLEAKHINLYRHVFQKECLQNIHIPEVMNKLSTGRLLTMSWLEGESIENVCKTRSSGDRNAIAKNIFFAWYLPFFRYGVIHGDPHPGNYTVRSDNSINLMDFGCVGIFRPQLPLAIIKLYEALCDGNKELAAEAYKLWGFSNPTNALIKVMNIWAKFIYAPFLEDKIRLIEETNTGIYGREVARKVYRELSKIGKISLPREFVLIDRASIGIGSVLLRIRAKLNWHRVFNEVIDGFKIEEVKERQKKALKASGLL